VPRHISILAASLWLATCGGEDRPVAAPAPPAADPERPGPPATIDPAPSPAPAAPPPDDLAVKRGEYQGREVGVEVPGHPEMALSLPRELSRTWSLHHADGWRLVVARREDDLVILLTDQEGTVTDDVTIEGSAERYQLVHDCGEDVTPSLILAVDCEAGASSATARQAWHPRQGSLVAAEGEIECHCDPS
jgi:hypothetical protein